MRGEKFAIFVMRVITGIVFGTVFWGVYFFLPVHYFTLLLGAIAGIIVLFEWKNLYRPTTLWFWLFLPVYLLLPFLLLAYLNYVPAYRILLLYLFLLAFTHDTGAYIVGSLIGYHKICPSISPKKTWEGAVGGYISALISLYFMLYERAAQFSWIFIIVLTLIASVLFTVGDLVESRLKRRAGIKDSGHFLPGHGGFLDRFDGILFAAFFVYILRDYLVVLLK